jgi:hypothetical protein
MRERLLMRRASWATAAVEMVRAVRRIVRAMTAAMAAAMAA